MLNMRIRVNLLSLRCAFKRDVFCTVKTTQMLFLKEKLFTITDAFDKHLRIKINDKNFE